VSKNGVLLFSGRGTRQTIHPGKFLLTEQPIDVLEVGKDTGGLVGDYGKDFKLTVPLKSLTITLK